jgi:hypothetical protein
VSDSLCLGVRSRPRAQGPGRVKAGHIADLGHEHGSKGGPDAVDGQDGVVGGVIAQHEVDVPVQEEDLAVVDLDEVSEDGDAVAVGGGEHEGVELSALAPAPHVVAAGQDRI